MRILVVDDEAVAAATIRRILKYRGYRQITVCSNGREAVEQIQATEFDVVIYLETLQTEGQWPKGLKSEVLSWIKLNFENLMKEWQKWQR